MENNIFSSFFNKNKQWIPSFLFNFPGFSGGSFSQIVYLPDTRGVNKVMNKLSKGYTRPVWVTGENVIAIFVVKQFFLVRSDNE